MGNRQFSVTMIFTYNEYRLFTDWYNNTTKKGFLSFMFPVIDVTGTAVNKEYRFVADNPPEYNNKAGNLVECKMVWEEC